MDNSNHENRANKLYQQIIEGFSYKGTNEETGEEFFLPTSYNEVLKARMLVSEIEKIEPAIPEMDMKVENIKNICDTALKRKFRPSILVLIIALIWAGVNMFFAFNNFPEKFSGKYKADEAQKMYSDEIERHTKMVEHFKSRDGNELDQQSLKEHSEKLEALQKINPETYLAQKNEEAKAKAKNQFIVLAYSLLILLAYIFAVRAPMFLIYKRREYKAWKRERNLDTSLFSRTFDAFTEGSNDDIFSNQPPKQRVYYNEDGSVQRTETITDSGGGGLAWLLLAILVIAYFLVIMYALPVVALYKYLKNYQYKFFARIARFFTWKKQPNNEEPKILINKNKRKLPKIDNLTMGQRILVRVLEDNYFYAATIETISENDVQVRYDFGPVEMVSKNQLCTDDYALKNFETEALWKEGELYYNCTVEKQSDEQYLVKYKDGTEETTVIKYLRFK
jgi:hypothetical protein